jgi:outer membrane lipoprotein-sorting protein
MRHFIPALLILTFASAAVLSQELTADQILAKADDVVNAPKCMSLTTTLIVKEQGAPDKVRQMKVWQSRGQRMVKFTQPAGDAGIALLSSDPDTNYVYLPAYEKVRRIASHVRNQTFMGTDFTQEDMAVSRYAKEYAPRLVGQTEEEWVLELTRRPESKASYDKLAVHVTKDHFLFVQIDYCDDKGEKIKVEKRSNPQLFDGKYWTLCHIVMTSVKDKHETTLDSTDFKFDEDLPPDFFSQRTLKRPVQ